MASAGLSSYFVEDNLTLFVEFAVGKERVLRQIGNEFDGPCGVCTRKYAVYDCLFFRGICIQLASDGLHTVYDVPRRAALCAFEDSVLHEMGQTVLSVGFRRAARSYCEA